MSANHNGSLHTLTAGLVPPLPLSGHRRDSSTGSEDLAKHPCCQPPARRLLQLSRQTVQRLA